MGRRIGKILGRFNFFGAKTHNQIIEENPRVEPTGETSKYAEIAGQPRPAAPLIRKRRKRQKGTLTESAREGFDVTVDDSITTRKPKKRFDKNA
ncbi:MAG: hypothetical protein ABIH20_06645 [Candidatus Diapherotrites archaeon]